MEIPDVKNEVSVLEITEQDDHLAGETQYHQQSSDFQTIFHRQLPRFSPLVRDALQEGSVASVFKNFVEECANFVLETGDISSHREYHIFGRTMYEAYPCIGSQSGRAPWTYFCKKLSKKLRNTRYASGKKRDAAIPEREQWFNSDLPQEVTAENYSTSFVEDSHSDASDNAKVTPIPTSIVFPLEPASLTQVLEATEVESPLEDQLLPPANEVGMPKSGRKRKSKENRKEKKRKKEKYSEMQHAEIPLVHRRCQENSQSDSNASQTKNKSGSTSRNQIPQRPDRFEHFAQFIAAQLRRKPEDVVDAYMRDISKIIFSDTRMIQLQT